VVEAFNATTGAGGALGSHFDHLKIAEMKDPFPLLAEVRRACPVVHSEMHEGFWALFTHGDISAAARDPQVFSSSHGVTIPHHSFPISLPPIETDPPQHMQFRGPLLERFSPKAVAVFEPELRAAVRQLIGAFLPAGRGDLAVDLAMPLLPAIAITELLNLPEEDRPKFRDWTVRLIKDPEDFDAVGDAMEYWGSVYDDRVASPSDDIPSLLLTLTIDGEPINEEQYLCLINVLVSAGLDTTANAGSNMLELLGERPELRDQLIADPTIIPQAIEELLRYVTPLPSLCRVTTAEVKIGDHAIGAGERVQLNWIAANHDPEVFEDPEVIRFDRMPARHVAFGSGPHRCMGAHLARLELKILLEEVLALLPDYRIVEPGVHRYSGITRGISTLPVEFTPHAEVGR